MVSARRELGRVVTRPNVPRTINIHDGTRSGHRRKGTIEDGTAHGSFVSFPEATGASLELPL
jgi:hypothetical protein